MNIQERIVSIKRHTIGYVVSGKELTRREAIEATRKGYIQNAKVVRSAYGPYLISTGQISLYGLPQRLASSRRFANKRNK